MTIPEPSFLHFSATFWPDHLTGNPDSETFQQLDGLLKLV